MNYQNITNEDIESVIKQIENNRYAPDGINENQKLSDAPIEIIFNITANAVEQNDKGENIQSKQICTKYYHIPVPLGNDYNIFMNAFFDFLEKQLASSASHAYNETVQQDIENHDK